MPTGAPDRLPASAEKDSNARLPRIRVISAASPGAKADLIFFSRNRIDRAQASVDDDRVVLERQRILVTGLLVEPSLAQECDGIRHDLIVDPLIGALLALVGRKTADLALQSRDKAAVDRHYAVAENKITNGNDFWPRPRSAGAEGAE